MTETIILREKCPTRKGILGGEIPEPEFVGTTCDVEGCDNYGYCPSTPLEVADDEGLDLVKLCWECAP